MWAGATNCGPFNQGSGRMLIINATINYIKHLQQVSGLWGRQEWPHNVRHGCADGACMGLNKAHGTNPLPNPLGGMFEQDWCRRGGKRSRYNVNFLSSRTCNMIFVDCLVQDAYGNVAIRIGRLLASLQHMYINQIGRR